MIEVDSLIEKIDERIIKEGGVCQNDKRLFGYLHLQFHNGWRKEIYEVNQTISKGKNPRLSGESDALGQRM